MASNEIKIKIKDPNKIDEDIYKYNKINLEDYTRNNKKFFDDYIDKIHRVYSNNKKEFSSLSKNFFEEIIYSSSSFYSKIKYLHHKDEGEEIIIEKKE